jgi:flagellar hook-length control protein FliK
VLNDTNILSSILEIPVKPELSFQVSRLEQNAGEQFDHVLRDRVDSHQDEVPAASSQYFEARERPALEHAENRVPVSKEEHAPPSHAENQHNDSRPITADSEQRNAPPLQDKGTHSDEPTSNGRINPFTLPLERLAPELNPIDTLDGPLTTLLNAEQSSAIDTVKNLMADLNVNSETIDQLVQALNNGDAAGAQSILNTLRGLLQASNQVVPASVANVVAGIGANRLNPTEQKALDLLIRAGLTQEKAQQIIQQARTNGTTQPATENSAQLAQSVIDAIASKANAESTGSSGNLQNSDISGSAQNSSEGPRNFSGLAADRFETLASLIAPDKAGNAQTNPLIAKLPASPLLNLNASGQPAQSILAEGTQAPAAVADAAAKGAEFVKPAVAETYNGRASMDKPITAQIIEKFTLRGFGNQREVHIKLDPPSLGTVRMNVSSSGETVRATIVAENHVVKSVIENNLSQLKDSITHQGVKIDSFNVLVGGNASHSAEGHKSALDYLGQLGQEGSMAEENTEEIMTLHRPIFLNENQSFSIFA